ncbi:HET-domain-containing protein [Biscogniauxia marginata]|nr:HET-domain-containing protein [Biscogniauxia marginata]
MNHIIPHPGLSSSLPRSDVPSKFTRLSLCQQCQGWGHINIRNITYGDIIKQTSRTSTTTTEHVSIEKLMQNHDFALCSTVLNTYYMRGQVVPNLQLWPPRRIGNQQGRIQIRSPDLSDPDYIVVNTFLELEVKCLSWKNPEEDVGEQCFATNDGPLKSATDEVRKASTLFTITSQFKMKYSREGEPALYGIEECNENETMILPNGFRVIDTQEMKIVQRSDRVRYMALSYMWFGGQDANVQLDKPNVYALEASGSIGRLQIPDIITDAITLCRGLGERYLWVDRLCIIQDDLVTKPSQINAMDRIYSLAAFTIIAALNTRNGVGLPGLPGRTRHPIDEIIRNVVDSSLWNKRGWTFQERLLSKRRLFITDSQVIYECCQGQALESLTWGPAMAYGLSTVPDSLAEEDSWHTDVNEEASELGKTIDVPDFYVKTQYSISNAFKETASIREYCVWVKDHSARQLTVGTDILSAFAGVANTLSTVFNSHMLYGLPEKYLAQCLLWVPVKYYENHDSLFFMISSIVYFFYQDPNQGLRKLEVEERWIHHEITIIKDLAMREELPPLGRIHKHLPRDWKTNQDWRECPHNPWQTFEHLALNPDACNVAAFFSGSLVFNTTVASLGIDHCRYTNGVPEKYEVRAASLINKGGESVGFLGAMESNWVDARRSMDGNKKLFEIIVLSGELEKYGSGQFFPIARIWENMWLLNAMLVERLPCKAFVARRVAVGTVKLCKWKDCEPRWETVVLC